VAPLLLLAPLVVALDWLDAADVPIVSRPA
jgi:hypothetical protein